MGQCAIDHVLFFHLFSSSFNPMACAQKAVSWSQMALVDWLRRARVPFLWLGGGIRQVRLGTGSKNDMPDTYLLSSYKKEREATDHLVLSLSQATICRVSC